MSILKINNVEAPVLITGDNNIVFNGIIIKSNVKLTIEANINSIDKNTNKEVTLTKIVTSYARYYNKTIIKGLTTNKEAYIEALKHLRDELYALGITPAKKWLGAEILPMKLGNKKLEPTTLIYNIGTSIFCISKNKGLCSLCGGCYAFSAELQYLNSFLYRLEQTIKFYQLSAESIANQICKKRSKIRFIRVNEAGDIFDTDDMAKIKEIAKICYEKKGYITYIYSHRLDLNLKVYETAYLRINLSDIDFIARDEINDDTEGFICPMKCRDCVFCKFDCLEAVNCLKHGALTGIDKRSYGKKYSDNMTRDIYYRAFDLNDRGYTGCYTLWSY